MIIKHWRIGAKLAFGFLTVLLIVGAAMGFTAYNLLQIQAKSQELERISDDLLAVEEMTALIREKYGLVSRFLIEINEVQVLKTYEEVSRQLNTVQGKLAMKLGDPSMAEQIKAVQRYSQSFDNDFTSKLIPAYREAKDLEAVKTIYALDLTYYQRQIESNNAKLLESLMVERDSASRSVSAHMAEALKAMAMAFAAALLASLAVSFLLNRWISLPLREVVSYSQQVAAGDLTRRELMVRYRDETGQLVTSFNGMVDSIKGVLRQVALKAEEVASASRQLAVSAEEVNGTAKQVATTVQQMALGAEEQSRHASDTSATIELVANRIATVREKTSQMAAFSSQALDTSAQGRQAVEAAVAQMETISNRVKETAEAVRDLGEHSHQIAEILSLITGVAEQTNLLALNAAIEAARAGEQGRGFAVVAEEVRKLAEQSAGAAQQIGQLVEGIQRESQQSSKAMEQSMSEVQQGTQVMHRTGEAFNQVDRVVRALAQQVREVATSAQEMASAAQQATAAIQNIAAITEEAAAGNEEVSAAAEEQTASIDQIAGAAEDLARVAAELQKGVSRFKL